MRYISAKIISISDLTDTYNEKYHTHYQWLDFNEILFGSRFPEGVRYFYYGNDIPNEDEFSLNLCNLLQKNFSNDGEIWIDTEA